MKCALCGRSFKESEVLRACRGCPLARGCRLIRCPYCGYENMPETMSASSVSRFLRKVFGRVVDGDK